MGKSCDGALCDRLFSIALLWHELSVLCSSMISVYGHTVSLSSWNDNVNFLIIFIGNVVVVSKFWQVNQKLCNGVFLIWWLWYHPIIALGSSLHPIAITCLSSSLPVHVQWNCSMSDTTVTSKSVLLLLQRLSNTLLWDGKKCRRSFMGSFHCTTINKA